MGWGLDDEGFEAQVETDSLLRCHQRLEMPSTLFSPVPRVGCSRFGYNSVLLSILTHGIDVRVHGFMELRIGWMDGGINEYTYSNSCKMMKAICLMRFGKQDTLPPSEKQNHTHNNRSMGVNWCPGRVTLSQDFVRADFWVSKRSAAWCKYWFFFFFLFCQQETQLLRLLEIKISIYLVETKMNGVAGVRVKGERESVA